jgi:DNA-binding winged helix-turn-helix (wHTH) protein/lipopolysaccharide biosynthesis regulator YciM
MKPEGIFQFGEFQINALSRVLRREDRVLALNRRSFDVLLYLVQNSGRILTHDELLKNVWPDAFVDENNLAQSISGLRRALGEKPGDKSYIITLPGRGYQFVAPVTFVAAESLSTITDAATAARDAPNQLLIQRDTIRTRVIVEEKEQLRLPVFRRSRAMIWTGVLLLAIVALAAIGYIVHRRSGRRLTEKDTVVLADFANRTGDPVFDDTLKTGLRVALNQSPFLNVLSDSRVATTLRMMSDPAGTRLTPEVVREVCQRAGSKAYIAGSIASLGTQYVVAVEAVNCQSGDTLAQEQATAPAKEQVLDALSEAASKVRAQLGESLATVKKYDFPLDQATTPSLEALKAYSLADKAMLGNDPAAALRYSQHAIELDPNFAMAYAQIGGTYYTLNEMDRASEYYAKAFQLRERASEGEKLIISAAYYGYASGQLDKAAQTFEEESEMHPRGTFAYNGLAVLYEQLGQYQKSVEASHALLQLDPDDTFAYTNLANAELALQHFDQARQIIQRARRRKLDDYLMRANLYALAFLEADSHGMVEQQQWFSSQPSYENYGLALASDTEAYTGHVRKARQLTERAVASAMRADNQEGAAVYQANFALQQAAYGNAREAQQAATEALRLAPSSPGVAVESALTFAIAGPTARAESLVQDLSTRFPLDTQMQSLWLPAIQTQLAMSRRNPGASLNSLPAASPIEFGSIPFVNNVSCLYPTYVRGEAYLAAGQGSAAAAEFQKILDHSGIVWNCWTGALAHLGIARANALQSRATQGADANAARVRALAAYRDFLTLWKDADPEISTLKQAKAEYVKLQSSLD